VPDLDAPQRVIETLPLDQILPYAGNPRRIPQAAIDGVAESIQRYGYQQPIVVDPEHVVIAGHTRLLALQQLGFTEAQVFVVSLPEQKAREFRLIDNRTSEFAEWDQQALAIELREFESGLLATYFPDVDLEIAALDDAATTQADVDRAVDRITKVKEPAIEHTTTVVCPSCFGEFEVATDSLPNITRTDLAQLHREDEESDGGREG
jgi:ParB-like chromosome segregation protein Spo0J